MLNCKTCGKDKPLTEMVKKSSTKSGYLNMCRSCRSELRQNNGEYLREVVRRHAKEARQSVPYVTENDLLHLMVDYPTCPYCAVELTQDNRTIDHVYPKSQKYGGKHVTSNLVYCCKACNSSKHTSHIFEFYKRSQKFTDKLWREFIRSWIGRMVKREITDVEISFMSEQLKAESEEFQVWHAKQTQQSERVS